MKQKFKYAIVGCGRIAHKHLDAYEHYKEELELVAVFDIVENLAMQVAEKYNVKYYTSYRKMLDNQNIDLIAICTPNGLHPEHSILAASKGIHVVCEKPMATNIKKANEMINACDENNVKLFVVKQNRLNTNLQLIKKAIEKKQFGKLYMATVNVFWTRPQSYYDEAKWRGTWDLDGGIFMNQAIHYVDMLYWLFGPVDSVMAFTGKLERRIETEDTGSALIRFRNGTIGSINATILTYPKNFEGSLTVIGEKGTVKVGGTAVNKIEKWEFLQPANENNKIESGKSIQPENAAFGHVGYYKNVIETIRGESIADIDGREGRKSLEIVQAIYQSARSGKRVMLPLEVKQYGNK